MHTLRITPMSEVIGITAANLPKEAALPASVDKFVRDRFNALQGQGIAANEAGDQLLSEVQQKYPQGGMAEQVQDWLAGQGMASTKPIPPTAPPTAEAPQAAPQEQALADANEAPAAQNPQDVAPDYETGPAGGPGAQNPQEIAPDYQQGGAGETAQDADPETPGFQSPEWAGPQMRQQMEQMFAENQRNRQFDEWATNSGFSKQQLAQLRQQMGGGYPQQMGGYPQQMGGYPQQMGGYPLQPQQQQQQPQQQGSFWGDVGRGAGAGAALGGLGGGAATGGIGAIPGAAVGGLAGGVAGGAKNLWNKGKNMWNQFQDFRKQPNQQPNQQPNPYMTASTMKNQRSEKRIVAAFLNTLDNDYDRMLFLEYVGAGMTSLEHSRVLTANTASARCLIYGD